MLLFLPLLAWISGIHVWGQRSVALDPVKAAVHGSVVEAGSNEPVRGAEVRLEATNRIRTLTDRTDEAGHFRFVNVDPGGYRLVVGHSGFLTAEYGQKTAQAPGLVISVVPPQRLDGDGFVVKLSRPSAITGYISGPVGEPVAAATVQALTVRYTPDGQKLTPAQTALSDDRGSYRLFGLRPGSYYVSSSYGESTVRPSPVLLTPNLTAPDDGYATLYFPNGVNPQTGAVVHVVAGADTNSINIAFAEVPRVAVRGQITGPDGPIAARVAFLPANVDPGSDLEYPIRTDSSGNFRIPNVTAGSYVLLARGKTVDGHEVFSDPVDVTVVKEDVQLSGISLYRGVDISGRVVTVDGTAGREVLDGLNLVLHRADGKPSPRLSATSTNGGLFGIADVPAAEYRISASPIPSGTYLAGTRTSMNGLAADSFRLLPSQRAGRADLAVVLSMSGSVIDGTVTDLRGDPVSGALVVFVPEKFYRRRTEYYMVAQTDESGRFEIVGVPPADYSGLAFERIEPGIYYDADFLSRFLSRAESVTIPKAGRTTVRLRLIPAEEANGAYR